jgi:hypothetical protein
MADEFPRVEVTGIDLAPIQPKYPIPSIHQRVYPAQRRSNTDPSLRTARERTSVSAQRQRQCVSQI